jgi:Gpi18-like mannosyltransferase
MNKKDNKLLVLVLLLILWIFLIVLINKLSTYFIFDRTSYEIPYSYNANIWHKSLLMPFLNFDGRNYLDIAERGYFNKGVYNLHAFFPLYPLMVRYFSYFTGINSVYSGLLLSFSFFFVGVYLFYLLMKDIKFAKPFKVLSFLIFFPTSVFFLSFYTESLFFLLVVVFFLLMNKRRYFLSSLIAALSSAVRINGLSLFPVLLFSAYESFKKEGKLNFSFIISPFGFLGYCLFLFITTGNPFEMISSQISSWNKPLGLLAPFYLLRQVFLNLLSGPLKSYDNVFVYPVIILEFLFLLFFAWAIVFSYNKIKMDYWIFMLANFLIVIFSGSIASLPRYMLVIFPLHLFLADFLSPRISRVYFLFSFVLFVFFSSLFLRGYFIS